MPDISGSGNADVTDDVGTLNGTPQGGPIDNIDMNGDDTVTVTNSTISGSIDTGSSDDSITIIDSTVGGTVDSGNSSDTVTVFGSDIGALKLGSSNDVLNFSDSTVTGTIDGGSGNNALNLPAGTIVNDDSEGTFTVVKGVSYTITDGAFTLPTGQTSSYQSFDEGAGLVCFARETLIATPGGDMPIEELGVGDVVSTYDGRAEKIRWIGQRFIGKVRLAANPKFRPGASWPGRCRADCRSETFWFRPNIAC